MHRIPTFLLLAAICGGCATASTGPGVADPADLMAQGSDDLVVDSTYASTSSALKEATETVAVGSCQYGLPLVSFAEQADLGQTSRGLISFDAEDALITVQLTKIGVPLTEVTTSVYRRQVNELALPFFGYGIGTMEVADGRATFRFATRNSTNLDEPPLRGFVHLRQDPASGRVIVFTAVWPMSDKDEERDARFLAIADRQTLSCS
jgi:hypothetical protein